MTTGRVVLFLIVAALALYGALKPNDAATVRRELAAERYERHLMATRVADWQRATEGRLTLLEREVLLWTGEPRR